jgi:hypothetical protein
MDIFNLNTENPDEQNHNGKFEKLDAWFDFMNQQFEKIEEMQQKTKINAILFDNDIKEIK